MTGDFTRTENERRGPWVPLPLSWLDNDDLTAASDTVSGPRTGDGESKKARREFSGLPRLLWIILWTRAGQAMIDGKDQPRGQVTIPLKVLSKFTGASVPMVNLALEVMSDAELIRLEMDSSKDRASITIPEFASWQMLPDNSGDHVESAGHRPDIAGNVPDISRTPSGHVPDSAGISAGETPPIERQQKKTPETAAAAAVHESVEDNGEGAAPAIAIRDACARRLTARSIAIVDGMCESARAKGQPHGESAHWQPLAALIDAHGAQRVNGALLDAESNSSPVHSIGWLKKKLDDPTANRGTFISGNSSSTAAGILQDLQTSGLDPGPPLDALIDA